MKKIIVFVFLLFSTTFSLANPIALPLAAISEFMFESDTNWTLEITFKYGTRYYRHGDFDSICVVTSKGRSRIKLDYVKDSTSLFVITPDSFIFPLSINNEGDQIELISYQHIYHSYMVDSVSFGNYPGSSIGFLPSGYSICRLGYYLFCKDKSPTIGLQNDTLGTCGTLRGYLFDKNGTRITNGNYQLDNQLVFNNDSMFTTRVFARNFIRIYIDKVMFPGSYNMLWIDSLHIDLDPDSLLEKDIHCRDYIDAVERINVPKSYPLEVMNYPNPFNPSTIFFIRIPTNIKYHTGFIHIYTVDGKRIYTLSLSDHTPLKWNGQSSNGELAPTGVYYYQLLLDNVVYKGGSMILLR